uniref:Reverse transcriptase N-terminal domain-containing protein n=1 Tax=Antithamnionella ternifolia TaxID=207919 RepID=A0A4D6WMC6_9FLOR|nr:hypothetical protein [Antithamnionella ternifolia]
MNKNIYQSFFFNNKSSWKLLPWKKIDTRILLIQQKIFKASKECNKSKIHRIQNYLLNSNEAKLTAINKIVNSISHYYDIQNNENYYFSDKDKYTIFKFILSNTIITDKISYRIRFIIEKIREYLIYLCINPEWKAKNEPLLKKKIYLLSNKKRLINHNKKHLISFYSKTILISTITDKLQSLPYISISIQYWIKNKFFSSYPCLSFLSFLLKTISLVGLEWYNLNLIKVKSNYKSNNASNFCDYYNTSLIQINNIVNYNVIIKQLFLAIKRMIYVKDNLKRNRFKNHLNLSIIIKTAIWQLQTIYLAYISVINKISIEQYLDLINKLLSILIFKIQGLSIYEINNIQIDLHKFFYKKKTSFELSFLLLKINR